MKKILLAVFSLFVALSLSGCFAQNTTIENNVTNKTYKQESSIDKQAIIDEIYDSVYEKIEQELREEIKQEIIDSFSGGIDLDTLQDQIYNIVSTCGNGNIGVTNYKKNTNEELVAYATGSAVIYDKVDNPDGSEYKYKYYFITNEHVVSGGEGFKATFADESAIDATLVGSDETTDIAVLYFESNNTYTVNKLGDSDKTKVGEIVLAIGNPKGETLFGSVTFGIIGGKERNLIEDNTRNTINTYLQHDAAINSGNSGGGLYNLDGECIGINSVKYAASDIEGLNFSIPINTVKKVAYELREYGSYSGNVSFGITVANVTDLTQAGRTEYGVLNNITSGILVISVSETGSAYGALEQYDIIIGIDGVNIANSSQLSPIIKSHVLGDTVTVKVLRKDGTGSYQEVDVQVTFKRAPKTTE